MTEKRVVVFLPNKIDSCWECPYVEYDSPSFRRRCRFLVMYNNNIGPGTPIHNLCPLEKD